VVAGCAPVAPQPGLHITTRVPGGGAEQIPATLSKPDGPGPFAAVVLIQDCSAPGAGLLERGFAAAVALDPRCAPRGVYRPTAPVLILIGERDDRTPAEACRRLAAQAQAARQPVSIRIYSKGEAAAFFAAHLK